MWVCGIYKYVHAVKQSFPLCESAGHAHPGISLHWQLSTQHMHVQPHHSYTNEEMCSSGLKQHKTEQLREEEKGENVRKQ